MTMHVTMPVHVTIAALHDNDLIGTMAPMVAAMVMAGAMPNHYCLSFSLGRGGRNSDTDGSESSQSQKNFAHFLLPVNKQTKNARGREPFRHLRINFLNIYSETSSDLLLLAPEGLYTRHTCGHHTAERALARVHALKYLLGDEAAVLVTVQLARQDLARFCQGHFHFQNCPVAESVDDQRRRCSNRGSGEHLFHRHDYLLLFPRYRTIILLVPHALT
jgi:hypothetical protein